MGLAALFPGVGYNDINLTVTVVNVTAPEAGSGSGEVGSGSVEAGRRLSDVVERLRVDAVINIPNRTIARQITEILTAPTAVSFTTTIKISLVSHPCNLAPETDFFFEKGVYFPLFLIFGPYRRF